jgi:hypothetical protein
MAGVPDVAELMQRTAIEASPGLPRAPQTARGLRHPRRAEALRRDGRTVGHLGARGSRAAITARPARAYAVITVRLIATRRPVRTSVLPVDDSGWFSGPVGSDGRGRGLCTPPAPAACGCSCRVTRSRTAQQLRHGGGVPSTR